MLSGPNDSLIFALLVLPTLTFWIVTLVRTHRAKDPRDADGRRVEVDEQRLRAAQRLNRRALLALVVASGLSLALRVFI